MRLNLILVHFRIPRCFPFCSELPLRFHKALGGKNAMNFAPDALIETVKPSGGWYVSGMEESGEFPLK